MANCRPARLLLTLTAFLAFLSALVIKSLAGFGSKSVIFRQTPADVRLRYPTAVTPARWAFYLGDFLYFWLLVMFLYFLFGLWRRTALEWMYSSPAVLPYGFHVSVLVNACLNVACLFMSDRELLLAALITSAASMLTAHMILVFSCQGLKVYGAWLHKYRSRDLWFLRISVQNGLAACAAWASLSSLLSLTVFLQHGAAAPRWQCARLSLLLLLTKLLGWFVLENFCLDEHVRYVLTVYPVVILWLTAILSNPESSEAHIHIFAALLLVVSCILFVIRTVLICWKHHKRPIYTDATLSPARIASTQRKIFL